MLSLSPALHALPWPELPVALALVLLTIAAYSSVFSCDYVNYDDPEYVLGLLAIAAYVRYARQPSAKRYILLLLAYAASLMAKPMLITLPALLLLLDYWPLRRWPRTRSAGHEEQRVAFPSMSARRLFFE